MGFTDGLEESVLETVLGVSAEDGGFAGAALADDDDFH